MLGKQEEGSRWKGRNWSYCRDSWQQLEYSTRRRGLPAVSHPFTGSSQWANKRERIGFFLASMRKCFMGLVENNNRKYSLRLGVRQRLDVLLSACEDVPSGLPAAGNQRNILFSRQISDWSLVFRTTELGVMRYSQILCPQHDSAYTFQTWSQQSGDG